MTTRQEDIYNAAEQSYSNEGKIEAFVEGAEWADRTMINKATEWLFANVYDYLCAEDQERVESFKKAMEG